MEYVTRAGVKVINHLVLITSFMSLICAHAKTPIYVQLLVFSAVPKTETIVSRLAQFEGTPKN